MAFNALKKMFGLGGQESTPPSEEGKQKALDLLNKTDEGNPEGAQAKNRETSEEALDRRNTEASAERQAEMDKVMEVAEQGFADRLKSSEDLEGDSEITSLEDLMRDFIKDFQANPRVSAELKLVFKDGIDKDDVDIIRGIMRTPVEKAETLAEIKGAEPSRNETVLIAAKNKVSSAFARGVDRAMEKYATGVIEEQTLTLKKEEAGEITDEDTDEDNE